MAATDAMTAPLLPEASFMNEISSDAYHYASQTTSAKNPESVLVEVPQDLHQDEVQKSSEEAEKTIVPETIEQNPFEVHQELHEESTQVVEEPPREISQEIPQETAQEVVQETSQEIPLEPTEKVQMTAQQHSRNKSKPIIPVKSELAPCDRVAFDPAKHIKFVPPSKVWTMQELGYAEGQGISPVGVSEPFPLFSEEAVQQMRAEILDEKVWDKYKFSSNLSQCQLRGYAPEYATIPLPDWFVLTLMPDAHRSFMMHGRVP